MESSLWYFLKDTNLSVSYSSSVESLNHATKSWGIIQKWLAKHNFWGSFSNDRGFFHSAARKDEILGNVSGVNIYTFPML